MYAVPSPRRSHSGQAHGDRANGRTVDRTVTSLRRGRRRAGSPRCRQRQLLGGLLTLILGLPIRRQPPAGTGPRASDGHRRLCGPPRERALNQVAPPFGDSTDGSPTSGPASDDGVVWTRDDDSGRTLDSRLASDWAVPASLEPSLDGRPTSIVSLAEGWRCRPRCWGKPTVVGPGRRPITDPSLLSRIPPVRRATFARYTGSWR